MTGKEGTLCVNPFKLVRDFHRYYLAPPNPSALRQEHVLQDYVRRVRDFSVIVEEFNHRKRREKIIGCLPISKARPKVVSGYFLPEVKVFHISDMHRPHWNHKTPDEWLDNTHVVASALNGNNGEATNTDDVPRSKRGKNYGATSDIRSDGSGVSDTPVKAAGGRRRSAVDKTPDKKIVTGVVTVGSGGGAVATRVGDKALEHDERKRMHKEARNHLFKRPVEEKKVAPEPRAPGKANKLIAARRAISNRISQGETFPLGQSSTDVSSHKVEFSFGDFGVPTIYSPSGDVVKPVLSGWDEDELLFGRSSTPDLPVFADSGGDTPGAPLCTFDVLEWMARMCAECAAEAELVYLSSLVNTSTFWGIPDSDTDECAFDFQIAMDMAIEEMLTPADVSCWREVPDVDVWRDVPDSFDGIFSALDLWSKSRFSERELAEDPVCEFDPNNSMPQHESEEVVELSSQPPDDDKSESSEFPDTVCTVRIPTLRPSATWYELCADFANRTFWTPWRLPHKYVNGDLHLLLPRSDDDVGVDGEVLEVPTHYRWAINNALFKAGLTGTYSGRIDTGLVNELITEYPAANITQSTVRRMQYTAASWNRRNQGVLGQREVTNSINYAISQIVVNSERVEGNFHAGGKTLLSRKW